MKVLLTGASGALGRATALALIADGHELTVFQRRPSALECREVCGDIADTEALSRAAADQDLIVHAAAKVDVIGRWSDFHRINVEGTNAVLEVSRQQGVRGLVHISTPAVAHAGAALIGVPAQPADPRLARGHYARSKAVAERQVLAADSAELAVLVLRPHLVWGPGDTQLVERIVERARRGRLPLIDAGAALIDTTYVDNAADAVLAAVRVCGPVHGRSFVVSNGEPRPVAEILARLCRAAGAPGPRGRIPFPLAALAGSLIEATWARTGRTDTPPMTRFLAEQLSTAHWFDQRETRQALRWQPRVSLAEGFRALAASYEPAA